MNRAIVIQGPSTNVPELKSAWSGYNLIWSTWKGEEGKYNNSDNVIYNQLPEETGVQNIKLQWTGVIKGIEYARELGYDRVLKWRSDMIPTNSTKLVELFDENSLNFLYWHNSRGGYFVDYIVEGDLQLVYNAWNISMFQGEFSEKITTDHIMKTMKDVPFNFIGKQLNSENDIHWIKKGLHISSYNQIAEFEA